VPSARPSLTVSPNGRAATEHLAQWEADAMETGILELSAFVAKLAQDRPAVQAALKLPYGQGQTEG
jgi:transposase